MSLRVACLAVVLLHAWPAAALAEELESSERGDWISDVSPDGKYVSVTDCPCEVPSGITFYCTIGSGLVLAKFEQFDWDKAKAGDTADIVLDIDGAAQSRKAKLIEQFPGFEARIGDPLFDLFAKGKRLKSTFGGKTIASTLRGSKKAMKAMREHCAPKGN
jgi:hypothetical protein